MKKTDKENPLTTFRKLNQARQGKVMKSLKKAQAGIQTNENSEDMMINKPGSTGGYKKPMEKQYPWGPPVELNSPINEKRPKFMEPTREYVNPKMDPNYNSNPPAPSNFSRPKALSERMSKIKQKKGGSVKRKK